MIKAIITDFDGTLVDTFEANFRAYQEAFASIGETLTPERYRECFGYRFEHFMLEIGINDVAKVNAIKKAKKEAYPKYFDSLRPNKVLISLIETFKVMGAKTAIASTARKENLMNAATFLGVDKHFDLIFAGVDVKEGKPSPEIYLKAMETLGVKPEETLIFEDSQVGIDAAKGSGAQCMVVSEKQFL
ncbi:MULTISPECIES: HAD family hydrolase [Bacteroides]|jgi:beta-phosphoglucomutase|uniref:HAD family hydrolase n=1 Tax=Bacteroides TaxID=816 RepID=UPI0005CBE259|nr:MULTISPECIES: HAD family phosphatase [Bacteroides]